MKEVDEGLMNLFSDGLAILKVRGMIGLLKGYMWGNVWEVIL